MALPPIAADSAPAASRTYRAVVLAMLLLVYTFNFIDRQILGILAGPIKAELGLSDTQLGLLGGLAFAILYSTMAIPLAMLADKTSRTWVITGSLAVWSGFTALCGAATGFGTMFLARLGVGVGEAGGVAPSYALIADYFPPAERSRALAVYSLGIPLGAALGVLFGAQIAARIDWRTAFVVIGLAGVVIAPLFRLVVREPKRVATGAQAPLSSAFALLAGKRSFWLMAFGAASCSTLGYGFAFWFPQLLQRSFGLDLVGTSYFYGGVLLLGGIAGVLGGGVLGDRLGKGDRGRYALIPAVAFVIAVPLFAAGILSGSVGLAFLLFLLPQALAYMWLAPIITAVQHLVPAPMRATASASFLLINNLVGLGAGTYALGALSDALTGRFGNQALAMSMLAGLVFYLLAAVLLAFAAKPLRREWVD
ncbi:spinster family MFS transporter [Sphingomonas sanxanigenens]|nr:MFS transporter [Sphingomonas sanxanigenens]